MISLPNFPTLNLTTYCANPQSTPPLFGTISSQVICEPEVLEAIRNGEKFRSNQIWLDNVLSTHSLVLEELRRKKPDTEEDPFEWTKDTLNGTRSVSTACREFIEIHSPMIQRTLNTSEELHSMPCFRDALASDLDPSKLEETIRSLALVSACQRSMFFDILNRCGKLVKSYQSEVADGLKRFETKMDKVMTEIGTQNKSIWFSLAVLTAVTIQCLRRE